MAAENSRKRFREEATCPICLNYFTSPMMLECGHNFCEICIRRCWQKPDIPTQCPQCRGPVKKHFKPNRCLMNMVEILNDWDMESEGHSLPSECQQHQHLLSLFCKEDQALLCGDCEGSQEHLGHNMAPMEEAAQEYKDQMWNLLEILRKAKASILDYRGSTESQGEDMNERIKGEMLMITDFFHNLRKFLEEQEKLLLTQIVEVETETRRRRDDHLVKISSELSSLERLILRLEKKCQQPASELLQNIQTTLVKYKERQKFETPEVFPPELKLRTWEFVDIHHFIQAVMKQFKDDLTAGLSIQKANLTLDPGTASPNLIVSADQKSVRAKPQDLATNQERFGVTSIVLGSPVLTRGRHFWDVSLEDAEHWAVGVVRESAVKDLSEFIMRRSCFKADSKKGIWALQSPTGSCLPPQSTQVLSVQNLKRVRVTLNYTGQRVAFFNIDHGKIIFAFMPAPFSDEPIIPFFWLGEGDSLILLP
ncbi:zinc finger protein RFP-like [Sceloporus undulatus]|uniref:zinc finger protein RFP-like n=1 Tax=Sceloporus undulatus TaxID=8520 RepID=UPI001C4B699F|nr:zinc finger protein RFP-like [Sceloporus undulatus]XP_042306700.1 zinc finger protein RFP-like [Sceloporus undulatus]XP_042306701.1 zinc finger protein RFP-like [Sceloporus undulatus]XP_042306702.1 zinc finger protein RFP-like [Sceloporus undulatus]